MIVSYLSFVIGITEMMQFPISPWFIITFVDLTFC